MGNLYETIKGCESNEAFCSGVVHEKRVCNLTRNKIDCPYQSNEKVQMGRWTEYYGCEYSKKDLVK